MTNKKNTMDIIKKALYHYFVGMLISASIVFLIIIFDYFFNGYYNYPQFGNFIEVCLISGVGFGIAHFASTQFRKTN